MTYTTNSTPSTLTTLNIIINQDCQSRNILDHAWRHGTHQLCSSVEHNGRKSNAIQYWKLETHADSCGPSFLLIDFSRKEHDVYHMQQNLNQ